MFLKNYTSNVPVSQTIHRIEQVLIQAKVDGITKHYDGAGTVLALAFTISGTPPMTVRMPVDSIAAQEALYRDYIGDDLQPDGRLKWGCRKSKKRADFKEQGNRTAWKIMQDWIEVQVSMIQLKQADPVQVFLPYVWDGQQTFYQALKSNGFKAMIPEKLP